MLAPSKRRHSTISQESDGMLTTNSEFNRSRKIWRWKLASIIASPSNNRTTDRIRSRVYLCIRHRWFHSSQPRCSMDINPMPTSRNASIAIMNSAPAPTIPLLVVLQTLWHTQYTPPIPPIPKNNKPSLPRNNRKLPPASNSLRKKRHTNPNRRPQTSPFESTVTECATPLASAVILNPAGGKEEATAIVPSHVAETCLNWDTSVLETASDRITRRKRRMFPPLMSDSGSFGFLFVL
ncbi:hypothetical protein Pdw03_8500 [Penicillium digitatum]|uniref:Uncharacterized protein n=1 Tax=Penicillium digitatum TaxID=36651 RepID=A0A7T7BLV6_PENDI|nr:hypothetical protein Pdw03_8500 [Penicillium digitatum]